MAIEALSNLARSASDAGKLLGPEGLSRVYRTTRAVKDLSQELGGANRNAWGLVQGLRNVGSSIGILGKVTEKVKTLRESTRQWLDDLFVVSAGALAAQYEEALWDIRMEAMDTFNQLRHQTLMIQTRLLVDDEQVRQAIQPLAAINIPVDQIREWAEWSLKVSGATGAAVSDLSSIAADLITFNVRTKSAYRTMDKLVAAVHSGYMTMEETVTVIKDAVELMGQLGRFGDRAFQTFAEGLALARATLNTMGIPNWEDVFGKLKSSISEVLDVTNEQGQRLAIIIAHYTNRSLSEVQKAAMERTSEYIDMFIQASFNATQQLIRNFGGLAAVLEHPWKRIEIGKILEEQFGLPREMALRLIGDAETHFKKLRDAGVSVVEAERLALERAVSALMDVEKTTLTNMQQQQKFMRLWQDFKSQISELTTAFKELGHTFMVSFGTPLLWVGKTVLKVFVVPLKELVSLFIQLNQRTHGLITYLTTLTIAWITFRKLLMASDILRWARTIDTAEQAMTRTAAATSAVSARLQALRQRSRLFDAFAGSVGKAASALKQRFVPAAKTATTAVAETGTAAVTSAALQRKAVTRAAKAIRWLGTVVQETAILQQRFMASLTSSLMTVVPALVSVLTNPYVLIGTAFVVGMNYFAKHKEEILSWLERFPDMVHKFVSETLVKTSQDFVAIIPDLVGALTKAIIIAVRELPSVIFQLIPAIGKAFYRSGVEAAKALIEGFKENFWGALATTLAIGWFVKVAIVPKLVSALLRFLPGPLTRALSVIFTGAGGKAAGALSKVPLFEPLLAGMSHVFDAFRSINRRLQRSLASVDWKKLLKAGQLNLLADKFVQVMRVGFDEVLKQGKLLWSALRTQLVKSKLGQALVTSIEGGFSKLGRLFRRRGPSIVEQSLGLEPKSLAKRLSATRGLVAKQMTSLAAMARGILPALAPMLTNPYVLAGAAVAAGIVLLWKYRKQLWEWAKSVGSWLKDFFGKLTQWVTKAIKIAFYFTPAGVLTLLVKKFMPDVWDQIVSGFKWVVSHVSKWGEVILSPFKALAGFVRRLRAWFAEPLSVVTRFVRRLGSVAVTIATRLKTVFAPLIAIVDKIMGAWQKVKQWFSRKKAKSEAAPQTPTATSQLTTQEAVAYVKSRTQPVVGMAPAQIPRGVEAWHRAVIPSVQAMRPEMRVPTLMAPVARRGAPATRPVPTSTLQAEPAELSPLTTIAENTTTMVELLRKIEGNTRKSAAKEPPAKVPKEPKRPSSWWAHNFITKYFREGHL